MRFEAKKKALTSAISDVRGLTETLELTEGSTTAVMRLKTDGKVLKVSSLYAEATVTEVIVEEPGDVVVDAASLLQALSVSGTEFKFSTSKGKRASYACGRVQGSVALEDVDLDESIFNDAPKPTIHVLNLKTMLSALALKAQGRPTDRTLHFDAKAKQIRGESTDSFRGVVVTVSVDKDSKIPASAALSLPQKTTDILAKLAADALVGFNDTHFTVKLPGFIAVIPLSSVEPLQIQSQLTEVIGNEAPLGEVVFNLSELKDALSDAVSAVGKTNGPALSLILTGGSTDALFSGESPSGEAQVGFKVEKADLRVKHLSANLTASYLQECLHFYTAEKIKCKVYQQAILLDLVDTPDHLLSQTTLIPLLALVEGKGEIKTPKAEDKAEDGEEAAPQPKAAKAKPAPAKPAEDEADEDEEEPTPPPKAKKPAPKAEAPAPAPKAKTKPAPEPEEDEDAATDDEDFDDEE